MGVPAVCFLPAAVVMFTLLVSRSNPAKDLPFYPLVLMSYSWSMVQNIWARKTLRPFQELYFSLRNAAVCDFNVFA